MTIKITADLTNIFVPKKDHKKRMCTDYCYLNDWTIKNAYLLPLISEIIDSSIYDGDTTTYKLKKVMSGKQHLLLGGGHSSHWLCFLA